MLKETIITAVIPTFQRPTLLKRAIASVQNQTFSELEILVLDSNSLDETEDVVREIAKKDPRVTYYKHPQGVTAVENFEFGLRQVKTPFFSFLADDDHLLPSFYETALLLLNKYPEAEFFLGSTLDAFLNAKPISAQAQHWPDKEFFLPKEGLPLVIQHYFNWTGAVFRTRTAQKHSLNPDVVPGDYDYIVSLAARYPFTFSSKPCAVFTHHTGSFSNHCGLQLIYPSFFKIAESIYKIRPEDETEHLKKIFARVFLRKSVQISLQNLRKKNFQELYDLRKIIHEQHFGFSGKVLVSLLSIFRFSRIPILIAFSGYRFLKSLKINYYLKKYEKRNLY